MSIFLSWIKLHDLAVVILYKKLLLKSEDSLVLFRSSSSVFELKAFFLKSLRLGRISCKKKQKAICGVKHKVVFPYVFITAVPFLFRLKLRWPKTKVSWLWQYETGEHKKIAKPDPSPYHNRPFDVFDRKLLLDNCSQRPSPESKAFFRLYSVTADKETRRKRKIQRTKQICSSEWESIEKALATWWDIFEVRTLPGLAILGFYSFRCYKRSVAVLIPDREELS